MSREKSLKIILVLDRMRGRYMGIAQDFEEMARIEGPGNQAFVASVNEAVDHAVKAIRDVDDAILSHKKHLFGGLKHGT